MTSREGYISNNQNLNKMKVKVLREVTAYEEFHYEVPDDFKDFDSLVEDPEKAMDYIDWEYLTDSADYTGYYMILDENNKLLSER